MTMTRGVFVAALAALLVAGCSKTGPEPEPETFDNASEAAQTPAPAEPAPPPEEKAPPVVEPTANTVEALPPEADPSREAQMIEDAEATGLTGRTTPADSAGDPASDPIGDLVENGGVVAP